MRYSAFIRQNYDILQEIIDNMRTGIWITDGEGKVLIVNNESVKTGGLTRDEVIGRTMDELLKVGYITESATLKVMASRKEECIVEELGTGGHCMTTSIPMFCQGEIDIIVSVERNISEVEKLKSLLNEQVEMKKELQKELLKFQSRKDELCGRMVTRNINMLHIREMAEDIGKIDAAVMITGESGTGKEVIADIIHKSSRRREAPFVKVNCAAIPETLMESEFFGYEQGAFTGAGGNGKIGLFELADGGTLFLDEVGELSIPIQSKLLRVLQDKEVRRVGGEKSISVDIRIIAATNRDLKAEVAKGTFRKDLYYRLFVVPIALPPLRERKEDIELLTKHFLDIFNKQYNMKKTIGPEAMEIMERYQWPGNVRELRNVVERLVVSGAGNDISRIQVEFCLKGSMSSAFEIGGGIWRRKKSCILTTW
ncbi:sigma-54 interaction domain-containing protein [Gallibacter sp. Marseille-QA0791]|uniref:sigma-54 interaction domain-containing protein n=1 Tax=Gallibacter sp. Marseille-QA0791 TaxID=3378781 RepID=UPI003D09FDF7